MTAADDLYGHYLDADSDRERLTKLAYLCERWSQMSLDHRNPLDHDVAVVLHDLREEWEISLLRSEGRLS